MVEDRSRKGKRKGAVVHGTSRSCTSRVGTKGVESDSRHGEDAVMRVRPLRTYNLPDLADHVIHFTGRAGIRINVDDRIEQLPDQERLLHIVVDQCIRGFETFGADAPVVCLTESTKAAVATLVADHRYTPCGIGFSKQFVFDRGGGPALYVRGDEWPATDQLLHPLRGRAVRFWPGADPDTGENLPNHLSAPSEWLHEREWRVPTRLDFGWDDVAFLIVPHHNWQSFYANWIEGWAGDGYARWFESIPAVVMADNGDVIHDGKGIWT
jgi:hypothetical protein